MINLTPLRIEEAGSVWLIQVMPLPTNREIATSFSRATNKPLTIRNRNDERHAAVVVMPDGVDEHARAQFVRDLSIQVLGNL